MYDRFRVPLLAVGLLVGLVQPVCAAIHVQLQVDQPTLTVGQLATVRLLVRDDSGTGIQSVSVNIEPGAAGVVEAQPPAMFVPPLDVGSLLPPHAGTPTANGGLSAVAASVRLLPAETGLGATSLQEAINFQLLAVSPGTVQLVVQDSNDFGYFGITTWGLEYGNPATYGTASVTVSATWVGDINGDGRVDIMDLLLLAGVWNTRLGDPAYDADADLNDDGSIDIMDLLLLVNNWNRP